MKRIHTTNKWSFIITLVLYLTLYFGLLAQIILGMIQVTLALILVSKWKSIQFKHLKKLILYIIMVLLYIPLSYIIATKYSAWDWAVLTIVPMGIASYFVHVTHIIIKAFTTPKNKQRKGYRIL